MKRSDIKTKLLRLKRLTKTVNVPKNYIMMRGNFPNALYNLVSVLSNINVAINNVQSPVSILQSHEWARYYNAWYRNLYQISQCKSLTMGGKIYKQNETS